MVALGNVANGANLKYFQVKGQAKREISADKDVNRIRLLDDLSEATGIDSNNLKDYKGQTVKVTAYLEKGELKDTDVYTVVIK